jgi:uncharacterized protein (DUF427 family)
MSLLIVSQSTLKFIRWVLVQGIANYYNVHLPSGKTLNDIIWWYRTPQLECAEIKGYVAFYDEKVDMWVDGEKVVNK